ncbi:hypothetical protein Taro_011397 [Colocasia esculenta]|uniref:Elongin-A n=1 Tax=Colocasia esculenta TaxID=4460 RepID=A0A843UAG3_COLES|nr:hypothetical protein [Colocasia esculenta]
MRRRSTRRRLQILSVFEGVMTTGYEREVPSLVKLCIQTAIDNIRYIDDVGETDISLLKEILPHCTVDQLAHIEKSTQGRDLSAVTDKLWKKFYERLFGEESVNVVVKRMKQKNVRFKWRLLYEAKSKEREEAQKKIAEQLKQRYAEEQKKRQSRQIQLVDKKPPSSNKRMFFGGNGPCYNVSNVKSNIMKKAKLEYLNSAARSSSGSVFGKDSASCSKPTKPLMRRP